MRFFKQILQLTYPLLIYVIQQKSLLFINHLQTYETMQQNCRCSDDYKMKHHHQLQFLDNPLSKCCMWHLVYLEKRYAVHKF